MMQVSSYGDSPSCRIGLQAGLDSIFQKIGKNDTEIHFVNSDLCRQIQSGKKRNLISCGKGRIIAYDAVSSLIFAKVQILTGDFTDSTGNIVFYFLKISLFRK